MRQPKRQTGPAAVGRGYAALASLFVPGSGQMLLGHYLRGGIWLAGFVFFALTGTLHQATGLLLMVVAAFDAWWIGTPAATGAGSAEEHR